MKVKLPAEFSADAGTGLNLDEGACYLAARFHVSLPGLDREVAQELIR